MAVAGGGAGKGGIGTMGDDAVGAGGVGGRRKVGSEVERSRNA